MGFCVFMAVKLKILHVFCQHVHNAFVRITYVSNAFFFEKIKITGQIIMVKG